MTKAIAVSRYMTSAPHSVGAEQTLAHAAAVMKKLEIRHLPVLHGGKLVGIISDRDLRLLESLADVNPALMTVSDAMTTEVYSVAPETPLQEVVGAMAKHKYGSAVILEHAKVVGIFTTVDVCNVLLDLLRPS